MRFEKKKLYELGEIYSGGTPSTKNAAYWDGNIPWITPKDLSNFHSRIVSRGARYITNTGLENSSAKLIPAGSVLMSSRAPIGYVAISSCPVTTNQGMKSIKTDDKKLLPEYLYYWIKSHLSNIIERASGSTFKEISGSSFGHLEIGVPSLDDQHTAVGVLCSIDDRIEKNIRINDNLEKLISVVYDKILTTTKCSCVSIKDLAQDIKTGGTPSTKNEKCWGGNIPFITIPDMHGVVYTTTTERNITELGASKSKLIPADSILVSCIATVGLVCISTRPSQTNQQINSVVSKNGFDVYFLYESLKRAKKELEQIGSTGSATLNVNKTSFGNIEVLYPGEAAAKKYYELTHPLFNRILLNQQENSRLATLRDTLLPELINGKIDLSKVEI